MSDGVPFLPRTTRRITLTTALIGICAVTASLVAGLTLPSAASATNDPLTAYSARQTFVDNFSTASTRTWPGAGMAVTANGNFLWQSADLARATLRPHKAVTATIRQTAIDAVEQIVVNVPRLPTGQSITETLILRSTMKGRYEIRFILTSTSTVTIHSLYVPKSGSTRALKPPKVVLSGLKPREKFNISAAVIDNSIVAAAWRTGVVRPAWQVTGTNITLPDAGSYGSFGFSEVAAGNSPVTVALSYAKLWFLAKKAPAPSSPPTVIKSATTALSATETPVATSTLSPTSTSVDSPAPSVISSESGSSAATYAWPSGASLPNTAAVAAFGAYRSAPVSVVTAFPSRANWNQIAWATWASEQYVGFGGTVSYALPITPDDSVGDLAAVAAGEHDGDFEQFARNLLAYDRGSSIIRLGWEFNLPGTGSSATDPTLWVAAFRRIVGDLRSIAPNLKIDWCGNLGSDQTGYSSFGQLYPGDDYVDIVGVDAYNNRWNPATTAADFDRYFVSGPGGLDAWRTFALAHHKKFSVPEWGLDTTGGGDNPLFIAQMHAYFAAHADDIAYEDYFNETATYIAGAVYPAGENPTASSTYATLWAQTS